MKILFISSGNNIFGISHIVLNQGKSLEKAGLSIEYFTIKSKGFRGYLCNVCALKKFLIKNKFNLIHAHYSLSAFVATLAGAKNLVVSLMGSDVFLNFWLKVSVKLFYKFFWKVTIVKTEQMKNSLNMQRAIVLPNGIDLLRFEAISKPEARRIIGIKDYLKIILFIADPSRSEKNFALAEESVKMLGMSNARLLPVHNIPNEKIPIYLSAGDVLILTSKWEGSVNVVKEGLACNIPIVSTDVGDVRNNIQGVKGCFICKQDASDIAEKLKQALDFGKRTNGRERIIELGLDAELVAQRLINIYSGNL